MSLALALGAGWGCSSSGGDDAGDSASDDDGGDDDGGDDDTGDGDGRYSLLIRGAPSGRLVVEVDAVAGMEPFDETAARVIGMLEQVVDKPDGVEMAMDGELASVGADHAWTFAELQAVASDTFDRPLPDGAIAIHVLFVDGHSADDTDSGVVLGIAWSYTHIAIFKQTVEQACAASALPLGLRDTQCRDAEFSILTHEVGHLLGLVDNGLDMVEPHRDPDSAHGRHDADDGCLMYWAYEGGALFDAIGERLLGGDDGAVSFDDACLADLAAERGR